MYIFIIYIITINNIIIFSLVLIFAFQSVDILNRYVYICMHRSYSVDLQMLYFHDALFIVI